MTGSWLKIDGNMVHINHSGPQMHNCIVDDCDAIAGYACDWKVGRSGKTCDAPFCKDHRTNVGKNKDLCPMHAEAWRNHPQNPERELDL